MSMIVELMCDKEGASHPKLTVFIPAIHTLFITDRSSLLANLLELGHGNPSFSWLR